jgi:hypothetical protein
MMLMTEWYGLRFADSSVGDVGGALNLHRHPAQRNDHKDRAKHGGPRQSIRAAMKNLRHSLMKSG